MRSRQSSRDPQSHTFEALCHRKQDCAGCSGRLLELPITPTRTKCGVAAVSAAGATVWRPPFLRQWGATSRCLRSSWHGWLSMTTMQWICGVPGKSTESTQRFCTIVKRVDYDTSYNTRNDDRRSYWLDPSVPVYSKSSTRDPDCRYPPLSRIIEGDTDDWNEVQRFSAGVHTYVPNLARRPLQSSCFFVEMCGHRRNRTETSRISNLAGANRKVNRGYSIPVARLPDVDLPAFSDG